MDSIKTDEVKAKHILEDYVSPVGLSSEYSKSKPVIGILTQPHTKVPKDVLEIQ